MPTYEYRCTKCGRKYEVFMTFAEHEKQPKTKCPKCMTKDVEQLPAQFQVVTSKKT